MSRKRVAIFFLIGLALGVGLGLLLGWVVWPVSYGGDSPAVLQDVYREEVAVMLASRYASDGDLAAAQADLAQLGDDWQQVLISAERQATPDTQPALTQLILDLGLADGLPTPTPASGGQP